MICGELLSVETVESSNRRITGAYRSAFGAGLAGKGWWERWRRRGEFSPQARHLADILHPVRRTTQLQANLSHSSSPILLLINTGPARLLFTLPRWSITLGYVPVPTKIGLGSSHSV